MDFPFEQYIKEGKMVRVFTPDVDSDELKWHQDLKDRKVTVVEDGGWQFQMENNLPIKLSDANQISIPKTIHIQLPITDENIEMVKKEIGFPLVVKPTNGVRGRGVSKCHNEDDLWFECLSMRKLIIPPKTAIAQKWIDHENKGTIRVYMIGGIIVASMQRKSNIKIDFFKSNIKQNSIRMPYEIDINLYNICERVYHAFNKIDLCSIDILHDGDNYMIIDINSPGSSFGMDMALNMNIGHLIAKYIASKI
jgi:gamma-F420-2:alpha-L-glutamate ligase